MNKKKLIQTAAAKSGQSQVEISKSLSIILETITESLNKGQSVQLVGFGVFSVKDRAARKGVNPRTKSSISIPAKKVIRFKASRKTVHIYPESK